MAQKKSIVTSNGTKKSIWHIKKITTSYGTKRYCHTIRHKKVLPLVTAQIKVLPPVTSQKSVATSYGTKGIATSYDTQKKN